MAERVPARLTSAQGRRFGLTVGAAFLVLAGIVWWRDHQIPLIIFGALGTVLVVAGLVIPTHLGPVERGWMAMAHAISKVTTPIVMGVMYLGVVSPIGLLRRTLGGNPLVHPPQQTGYWHTRPEGRRRSMSLRRQF